MKREVEWTRIKTVEPQGLSHGLGQMCRVRVPARSADQDCSRSTSGIDTTRSGKAPRGPFVVGIRERLQIGEDGNRVFGWHAKEANPALVARGR